MSERWLTLAEVAERVGRSQRTIRRWVEAGDIASIHGRFRESAALEAERRARSRVGRPRKRV